MNIFIYLTNALHINEYFYLFDKCFTHLWDVNFCVLFENLILLKIILCAVLIKKTS